MTASGGDICSFGNDENVTESDEANGHAVLKNYKIIYSERINFM